MPDPVLDNQNELDLTPDPELEGGGVVDDPTKKKPPVSDELAASIKELVGEVKASRTQPKAEEKKLTPEEERKLWAVFDPEEGMKDFYKKFFRHAEDATPEQIEETKALFAHMHKGMMRQVFTGVLNILTQKFKERDEIHAPVHEYVSQTRAREMRSRFNESYPIFEDRKYDKMLKRLSDELLADNEYKTEEEYFKALAENAADLLKTAGAEIDLGQKQETKKPAGTTPKLPRGGAGGTGGAGGSGQQQKQNTSRDDADGIFD